MEAGRRNKSMKKSKTKYIFNRAVALVLTAAMLVTGAAGCPGGGVLRQKLQQAMG